MKTLLTALLLVVGLAACADRDRETGRVGEAGESADTSVMTRTTQDTMIVTSDTNVQTDTTVKEGESRDTLNR